MYRKVFLLSNDCYSYKYVISYYQQINMKGKFYDKNTFCLSWKYMQKSDGGIYNERYSQKKSYGKYV